MSNTAIADKIHQQADLLLQRKKIVSLLSGMGQLYFTGSYALNLMTWNDIDMQLVVAEGTSPVDALVKILGSLARTEGFLEAKIAHCAGDYKPKMPRGHYLNLKFDIPDLGGTWKLDVWTLAKEDFERGRALLEQLQKGMTDSARQLILEIKHELMKPAGRVPQGGSHWLYQAVLLHGLSEKKAILDFLRSHGVSINY